MDRIKRILLSFLLWLVPVVGIYFGIQVIRGGLGFFVGVVSALVLMPLSGILSDAITGDKVLYLNIYYPWKSHLRSRGKIE